MILRQRVYKASFFAQLATLNQVSGKGYNSYCDLEGRLMNADSHQHFQNEGDFKDYLVSPSALGVIGFLTDRKSVCNAVCETDVEVTIFSSTPGDAGELAIPNKSPG